MVPCTFICRVPFIDENHIWPVFYESYREEIFRDNQVHNNEVII